MKKIKEFLKKNDEFLVIILFFIMSIGYSLYVENEVNDELWNFQNIYKMYNGYKIYVDANVIITPIFHVFGLIIFKIFGANFLIFRLYNLTICVSLFFGIYKVLKTLKIGKKKALIYSLLVFSVSHLIIYGMANYNTLALTICVYAMYVILNKENTKWYVLKETILITLIILTKQNIGAFYILGLIMYTILNKKEFKNTIKIFCVIGIFAIAFILILYFNNILYGFINYAILGISEFDKENKFVDIFTIYFIFIALVNSLLLLFINTSDKYKNKVEKKQANNVACFAYPLLGMSYPIFNIGHILDSLIIQYILLVYILNLILKDNKILKNKIKNYVFFILGILIIFYYPVNSMIDTKLYIEKVLSDEYKYSYDNPYFGTLFQEDTKIKIDNVTEFIKNSDKEVIVISPDAALYMIPLKQNNKEFDLVLLGNLGKDGEDGIIEQLRGMDNKIILMNKEKICWQESDKIVNFVKNNFTNAGEIEDMLIYK